MTTEPSQLESRWPHRLAVVLACATFPLIWVGGLVTTTQAGMAVPDWPNTFGYNLFLYPWQTWLFGPWDLFIEHSHRLLGATAGLLCIALLVSVWFTGAPNWLRWATVGLLAAVIGQGVLGGMRVLLDERTLAKIHGCTGPLFFALCVAMVCWTSRTWLSPAPRENSPHAGSLQRLAVLTALVAYVQLVLGAQLRHVAVTALPGEYQSAVVFHLVMAAVLVLHGIALAVLAIARFRRDRRVLRPALLLLCLVIFQVLLGGATWLVKFGRPGLLADGEWGANYTVAAGSFTQSVIVTAHVATGSLILATAMVVVLNALRWYSVESRSLVPRGTLLGVAA